MQYTESYFRAKHRQQVQMSRVEKIVNISALVFVIVTGFILVGGLV